MAPAPTPHRGCREWAITAYSYKDRSDTLEAAFRAGCGQRRNAAGILIEVDGREARHDGKVGGLSNGSCAM
jgi:hypothetical protein